MLHYSTAAEMIVKCRSSHAQAASQQVLGAVSMPTAKMFLNLWSHSKFIFQGPWRFPGTGKQCGVLHVGFTCMFSLGLSALSIQLFFHATDCSAAQTLLIHLPSTKRSLLGTRSYTQPGVDTLRLVASARDCSAMALPRCR